jgi:FlaA1/EpsC-like NDP-sugar epimerase
MPATRPTITARLGKRLVSMHRFTKIGVMLTADLVSLPLCFMIALLLRLGNFDLALHYGSAPHILIVLITIPVFAMTGLYGAIIRFIDLSLLTATGIALAVVVAATYLLSSFFDYKGLPHSAVMIYWFIAFSYVVTSRLMARALLRNGNHGKRRETESVVAIYGAGEAGAKLALAMRVSDNYRAVCFFDDKDALDNRNVAGLKVYRSSRLVETVKQRHIELIVIAIPSATPDQRREIMYRANKASAHVKILCGLMELADEEISTHSIRDLKIDDLLGREPIRPQSDLFAKCARGQSILVTGAGGSIGSELCRQIMTLAPRQLHMLDHCEYALYNIQQELIARFPDQSLQPHLGSACDARLVERIMGEFGIDTVYHAAAYKHVPLVEDNMAEGIRNNILSAEVVATTAEKFNIKTCVLVSTDKAVRPTSIMGASKRIAELLFQTAAIKSVCGTKFCMVRFGNVLGSSGSVVPLFKNQIERGGPITITHPEVVRYFMSISEAAQLVMQAGAMAVGGDVFVMDMGEPVRIVDLARTMLAMCGLKEKNRQNPDGDIEIHFVGLRPGEKLYEELFAGNDAIPSAHPRIMTTTEYVIDPDILAQQVAYLMVACATNDKAMIRFLVQKLVRGYSPEVSEAAANQQVEVPLKIPGTHESRDFATGQWIHP